MCPDLDGARSSSVDITEVIRFERVRLNVNSDPTKYATAHLSIFRWSGVRDGGPHFEYQPCFPGGCAVGGVEGREESSESDSESDSESGSESYPTVEAWSDSCPSSRATRRKEGAPAAGDSERVARSVVCWNGDGTALSLTGPLKAFLVRNCPSFSILCSNTDHSRFEDPGRLKEANTVPCLVRELLSLLHSGNTDEETIRFETLGRVGRDCSSTFGGEVLRVWVFPSELMELVMDASRGW